MVAQKVLEVTIRQDTVDRVQRLIARFRDGLAQIRVRHPYLVEIRQSGLVIGLKFDHPTGAVYVQEELYRNGVWAIASGFDQSVLQFKPGLLLQDAMCDEVLDRLQDALNRAKDADRPVPSRHRLPASRLTGR
jgi:acetylornithine/succinyldiaminopimelate/putrescine aminotransferase